MDASLRSSTLIAIRSWQDATRALIPLAEVFAATAALLVAVTLFADLPAIDDFIRLSPYRSWFAQIFLDICRAYFATPLLVAMCRYVLLGEEIHAYRFVGRDRRSLIFFVFLNFLFLAQAALSATAGAVKSLDAAATGTFSPLISATLLLALAVSIFVVQVRLIMLFPVLAIDVEGADVGIALTGAGDQFWTIFQTLLLTGAPVVAAVLGLAWWLEAGHGLRLNQALQPLFAFFAPLWLAVAAAMASRLYEMLG